jgi:hypothetical protein
MKVAHFSWTTGLTVASLTLLAMPGLSLPAPMLIASRRAQETCLDAVQQQGLRVTDVVEQNDYAGGSEIILRGRTRNQSFTVGCDYAENTGRVQLYQLEGRDNSRDDDREDDREDDWDDDEYGNRYNNDSAGDRRSAERIARQEIERQLGVDADSDVIEIDQTRSSNRNWYVEGNVNGAPFEVRIRQDGSVEDFVLR